jgi:hypothetical protein
MTTIVIPGAPAPIDPMLFERMSEVVRLLACRQLHKATALADQVAYELGLVR